MDPITSKIYRALGFVQGLEDSIHLQNQRQALLIKKSHYILFQNRGEYVLHTSM